MLSLLGWINGVTVIICFVLGIIWGIFVLNRYHKSKSKVLFYVGLFVIFISLLFLGLVFDFLAILITGNNLDNTYGLHGILIFIWFGPLVISGVFLFTELIVPDINPKLKKLVFLYFLALMIIYEAFLFLDPFGSVDFSYPLKPGENLIDNIFISWSPLFLLLAFSLFPGFIIFGFVILIKIIKSTGVIRKKLLFLLIAIILFFGIGSLDILIFPSEIILIIIRYIIISSGIFLYLAVKEENIEIKEDSSKRMAQDEEIEISLIQTLSDLRPSDITEEDISFYRKEIICLVCKKKNSGFYQCIHLS